MTEERGKEGDTKQSTGLIAETVPSRRCRLKNIWRGHPRPYLIKKRANKNPLNPHTGRFAAPFLFGLQVRYSSRSN